MKNTTWTAKDKQEGVRATHLPTPFCFGLVGGIPSTESEPETEEQFLHNREERLQRKLGEIRKRLSDKVGGN